VARSRISPQQHGLYMSREKWMMQVVRVFEKFDGGKWSVDELLLHPRVAIRFCNEVMEKVCDTAVPHHFILRTIMVWRKSRSKKKAKA
jgi:hypothetical protein